MGRYREAAALLLFTSAAFMLLALMSAEVDPFDPTLGERNWVGPAGAAVANFLAQGFGLVSWLAPFELALIGAPLFRGRTPARPGPPGGGGPGGGSSCSPRCSRSLRRPPRCSATPRAGGNVGLLFGELMREFFSTAGSFLIGPTVVGLILIGRSSFSFIALCQRSFDLLQRVYARLVGIAQKFLSAWFEARRLRKDEIAREKVDRQPIIDTHQSDAAILLHLEDDDSDWIPMEQTGAPPLALSQSLKNARPASFSLLLDPEPAHETASPPSVTVTPPPAVAKVDKAPKSDKANKSEKSEKPGRAEKNAEVEKPEKPGKAEKNEKAEKNDKKKSRRKPIEAIEEEGLRKRKSPRSTSSKKKEEEGAEEYEEERKRKERKRASLLPSRRHQGFSQD